MSQHRTSRSGVFEMESPTFQRPDLRSSTTVSPEDSGHNSQHPGVVSVSPKVDRSCARNWRLPCQAGCWKGASWLLEGDFGLSWAIE